MFVSEPAARARLPVVLLTGFLGSGKTTLVNALLGHRRLADTAVAVNEFGEIALDQALIAHGSDRTVTLANGCLCCDVSGAFDAAVLRIFARREAGDVPRFVRLIVELSGLADPAPVAQAILRNPALSRLLRLEAILATADAARIATQLTEAPEAAGQIALADRLILTKPDLADPAAAIAALRTANPRAPILPAARGAVDPVVLLPQPFLNPALPASPSRAWLADSPGHSVGHSVGTAAVALTATAPLHWHRFDAWLRRWRLDQGAGLLRVKGILDIAGTGPVVLHGVGHVLEAPVALPAWPDQDRRSRLVLIGRALPAAAIRADWTATLPDLMAV